MGKFYLLKRDFVGFLERPVKKKKKIQNGYNFDDLKKITTELPHITVKIGNEEIEALLDTGAQLSLLDSSIIDKDRKIRILYAYKKGKFNKCK